MGNTTKGSHAAHSAVVKFDGPRDVLIAARKLIEKPENWCRGYLCRLADGSGIVGLVPPEAVSFCANGAIMKAGGTEYFARNIAALQSVLAVRTIEYNDHYTHSEVLAAFDRAIEQAGTVTEQASAKSESVS